MTNNLVSNVQIRRVGEIDCLTDDLLVTEEPLEIRLVVSHPGMEKEMKLSVTMRTPGSDFELVKGFLFTEGFIKNITDIESVKYCQNVKSEERGNVVKVTLSKHVDWIDDTMSRNFYTTSSCGICGKSAIDSIYTMKGDRDIQTEVILTKNDILNISDKVLSEQIVFRNTGGIHAAALLDRDFNLVISMEDIGRHNAVDKTIGAAMSRDLFPLNNHLLFVSGRAGFELVQKAAMAGIGSFIAVGAPSSLAVDLAQRCNMNLIGFLRKDRYNIYNSSNQGRVKNE